MKKQLFWIVPLVLLIFVAYLSASVSYFNRVWFNVEHVLLFGLIIYTLLTSLYLVYRFFILRYKLHTRFKTLLITLFVLIAGTGTVAASNLQLAYIEEYETPQIEGCTYYDYFGNLLYETQIENAPTKVSVENEYPYLIFEIEESYSGKIRDAYTNGDAFGYIENYGDIIMNTVVSIEYLGTFIKVFDYQTTITIKNRPYDNPKGDIMSTEGYMYQKIMELDTSVNNELTIHYTTRTNEFVFEDTDYEYPDFNEIEAEMSSYKAVKIEDESSNYLFDVLYDEITYDEEENEVINQFAIGQYANINENVVGVNFYENGLSTNDYTDYSFDINYIQIKNSDVTIQQSGVDRRTDIRELYFTKNPVEIGMGLPEGGLIASDFYFFEEFRADISGLFEPTTYSTTQSLSEIENEVYIYDQEYYTKLEKTEYGVLAIKFNVKDFSFFDLFRPNQETEPLVHKGFLKEINSKEVANIYDFKRLMQYPGGLSRYDFYQHNHLIEFFFIDDYEEITDKNPGK